VDAGIIAAIRDETVPHHGAAITGAAAAAPRTRRTWCVS
jgi:hypothetical protein